MEQLYDAFQQYGLTSDDFLGSKYLRIKQISKLMQEYRLDADLQWTSKYLSAPKSSPSTVLAAGHTVKSV